MREGSKCCGKNEAEDEGELEFAPSGSGWALVGRCHLSRELKGARPGWWGPLGEGIPGTGDSAWQVVWRDTERPLWLEESECEERLVGDEIRRGGVARHSSRSLCRLLEGLWGLPLEGKPWVVWCRGAVRWGLF